MGDKAAESEPRAPSFASEIRKFIRHADAIGNVMRGMIYAVASVTKEKIKGLREFEDEHCEVGEDEQGVRTVNVPSFILKEYNKKVRQYDQFALSERLMPMSVLVSLISQYDAFLGRLMRTIYLRKPELLNASDRKISFEELEQFSSIDAAREYMLEKEIESLLRSSHSEQFRWMEKKFELHLTKDLTVWPAFIEITERRNLFVHTDGVVSSQYISVCRNNNVTLPDQCKEGESLWVSPNYFETAHAAVFEIGIKLSHVLWRKLFPTEKEKVDSSLNEVAYALIDHGSYSLAITLLDFAHEAFKGMDESHKLRLTVNRAQAQKWAGNQEACNRIMKAVQWNTKSDDFRLANAVLSDDWKEARRIMERIGKSEIVSQDQYRDWPLFQEFRKTEVFQEGYLSIFGQEFRATSVTKKLDNADIAGKDDALEAVPLSSGGAAVPTEFH